MVSICEGEGWYEVNQPYRGDYGHAHLERLAEAIKEEYEHWIASGYPPSYAWRRVVELAIPRYKNMEILNDQIVLKR